MSQINRKVAITRIFFKHKRFSKVCEPSRSKYYLFGLAFQTPAQVLKYAAVLVGVREILSNNPSTFHLSQTSRYFQ